MGALILDLYPSLLSTCPILLLSCFPSTHHYKHSNRETHRPFRQQSGWLFLLLLISLLPRHYLGATFLLHLLFSFGRTHTAAYRTKVGFSWSGYTWRSSLEAGYGGFLFLSSFLSFFLFFFFFPLLLFWMRDGWSIIRNTRIFFHLMYRNIWSAM